MAPVRLRFGGGTVRAVPVFGSGGSLREGGFSVFEHSLTERTVPVPVSVPEKRFRRFRFRVRFLGKRFRRFRFPVPVRFLGHPESNINLCKSLHGNLFRLFRHEKLTYAFMYACIHLSTYLFVHT